MDPGVSKILETGLLGAIVVILMGVVKYLFTELLKEKDKRIADAQETTHHVTLTIENVNETLKAILVGVENGNKKG